MPRIRTGGYPIDEEGLEIAVVGCGMTGPAAALYLSRGGHRVRVFERAPHCEPVGAGFLLQPTGLSVLDDLGILGPALSLGSRVDRLEAQTVGGKNILDLNYAEVESGSFGLGLQRSALLQAFLAAMEKADVSVEWGCHCKGMVRSGSRWRLLEECGDELGEFDLVVIADGARSSLREVSGIPFRSTIYPWGAWWLIAEDRERAFRENVLYQVVDGTRTLVGALPCGRSGSECAPLVSIFWSVKNEDRDLRRWGGLELLTQQMARVMPEGVGLLNRLDGLEQVADASYLDVRAAPWVGDGVILLGDSGHAMSPQLGQGVNLGLVDAFTLADSIRGEGDISAALASYGKRRRNHLGYYQIASRLLTPVFQSGIDPLGWLRDPAFGLAMKIPAARRLMVRSMMGGIFAGDSCPRRDSKDFYGSC